MAELGVSTSGSGLSAWRVELIVYRRLCFILSNQLSSSFAEALPPESDPQRRQVKVRKAALDPTICPRLTDCHRC